jgi:uncharacterized RDD family membrane protein YckC
MATDFIPSADAPEGFKSAAAKRTLTIAAIVAAVLSFLVQVIGPLFIILPMMMDSFRRGPMNLSVPALKNAAYWNERIWIPEQTSPFGNRKLSLLSLDVKAEGEVERLNVDLSSPSLLPDGDQLWIIGTDGVSRYADGKLESYRPLISMPAMSRPFLLNGLPSVVAPEGEKHVLWSFADGEWQRNGQIRIDLPGGQPFQWNAVDSLQVVTIGETMHVFVSQLGAVYYHEGLPRHSEDAEAGAPVESLAESDDSETVADDPDRQATPGESSQWEPTGASSFQWTAIPDGDRPLLVYSNTAGPNSQVIGMARTGPKKWLAIVTLSGGMSVAAGMVPTDDPEVRGLLTQGLFGGLTLAKYRGANPVAIQHYTGIASPSAIAPNMNSLMFVPQLMRWASIVIFAVVMCALMNAYRDPYFRWPEGTVRYAPLWRRGAAVFVDSIITSLPFVVASPWLLRNFRFEHLTDPSVAAVIALVVMTAILWWFVALIGLSFMEGVWGFTPGKLMLGIRAVNTDLKPCGFPRAVVRRILLIVDALFSFAVGLLLIALTSKQQRLGDLAASTVVLVRER